MPRMRILSTTEQEQFEKPPVFDSYQRKKLFNFPKSLLETAQIFRKISHRIGFLVSCGYFNAAKRFFAPKDYQQRDIDYVARHLNNAQAENFDAASYADRTRQRHEHIVLEFYGFKRFDSSAERSIASEIASMVQTQLKPKLIFLRCIDFSISQRIQVPNYHRLTDLILSALNQRKQDLSALIESELTSETKYLLEALFVQTPATDVNTTPSKTTRYKLTLLKKLSQSTRPTRVKERVNDLAYLAELYERLSPVLSAMDLNHEGIRYYAGSVIKSKMFQLHQRSDEDRYVHVTAFVAHQYYRLQDNLVDVLLSVVQSFQNSAQREHKDQIFEQRKVRNDNLTSLLSRLDDDIFAVLRRIRKLTHNDKLSDADKVNEIRSYWKVARMMSCPV